VRRPFMDWTWLGKEYETQPTTSGGLGAPSQCILTLKARLRVEFVSFQWRNGLVDTVASINNAKLIRRASEAVGQNVLSSARFVISSVRRTENRNGWDAPRGNPESGGSLGVARRLHFAVDGPMTCMRLDQADEAGDAASKNGLRGWWLRLVGDCVGRHRAPHRPLPATVTPRDGTTFYRDRRGAKRIW